MAKRILLIDSDEPFAQALSSAMIARGFAARVITDSDQGMELVRTQTPDLVVVSVEAQPTNGYMLCTRLKKDEQLKSIPLVLISSTATPDAFEKHSKLKTRAEEYLIRPFAPQVILEKVSAILATAADGGEQEILAVEDEPMRLGDLVETDGPIPLSEQDAAEAHVGEEGMVVEEVEELALEELREIPAEGELREIPADEDLAMFDKAFDSVSTGPVREDAGAASENAEAPAEPGEVEVEEAVPLAREITAPDDEAVLSGLMEEQAPARPAPRAAPVAAARAALEKELAALRAEVSALAAERDHLVEERDQLRRQIEELQGSSQQNEDRAVKAYKQLKEDEKLRDKARQALEIALRLLEESGGEHDDVPAIKSA